MKKAPISVIAAGNVGDVWAALKEFPNVWANSNSVHSCYGTGVEGCESIAALVSGGSEQVNKKSKKSSHTAVVYC